MSSFYHMFSILDSKIKLSVYILTVFIVSYNFPFASDPFCVESISILLPVQGGRHFEKRSFSSLFWIFLVTNDTTEFRMFNLPVVYVYGSFPFDLDTIYLILVHINSTFGSKWPQFWKSPLTGQNCNFRFASIAYLFCHLENCLCAKFHAFNRKWTIEAHICSTRRENIVFMGSPALYTQ